MLLFSLVAGSFANVMEKTDSGTSGVTVETPVGKRQSQRS